LEGEGEKGGPEKRDSHLLPSEEELVKKGRGRRKRDIIFSNSQTKKRKKGQGFFAQGDRESFYAPFIKKKGRGRGNNKTAASSSGIAATGEGESARAFAVRRKKRGREKDAWKGEILRRVPFHGRKKERSKRKRKSMPITFIPFGIGRGGGRKKKNNRRKMWKKERRVVGLAERRKKGRPTAFRKGGERGLRKRAASFAVRAGGKAGADHTRKEKRGLERRPHSSLRRRKGGSDTLISIGERKKMRGGKDAPPEFCRGKGKKRKETACL